MCDHKAIINFDIELYNQLGKKKIFGKLKLKANNLAEYSNSLNLCLKTPLPANKTL